MGLDHSEALVRIMFDGVMVFRFNKEETRCEVGLISEPRHLTHMKITKFDGAGHSFDVPLDPLDKYKDIWIDAVNPVKSGISAYQRRGFKRKDNKGDPEDFAWIVNLENKKEFHEELMVIPGGLKSKLYISTGIFHSYLKTVEFYGRKTTKGGPASPFFLGKLGHNLGIDIVCYKVSGLVELKNERGHPLRLPSIDEKDKKPYRYEIEVGNYCDPVDASAQLHSDFPLVYRAVKDPTGVEFDLEVAVKVGDPRGARGTPYENKSDFRRDGEPEVCNQFFLGTPGTLSG